MHIVTRARLGVSRARFWVQKTLMLPASTQRAYIVLEECKQLTHASVWGKGDFCNVGPCRSKLHASFSSILEGLTFGQLQRTRWASETYDFWLRFLGHFLGGFLNASSSQVTSLQTALRAQFWSHGNLILGATKLTPIVWIACRAALYSPPCDQVCFPHLGSSFRVALRALNPDRSTFRAVYHEAGSASGIRA